MVTIVDVAKLAEVSTATVSNVIRDRGRVGETARRRVLDAIDSLGYRPNLRARSLVERQSRTLALVVGSLANPADAEFALAVERAVRRRGRFLVVGNSADSPKQANPYLDPADGPLVDAVLFMHSGQVRPHRLRELYEQRLPVVLCMWDRLDRSPDLPCVAVDFEMAGRMAANHLLELGHRRLGALIGTAKSAKDGACYRGFRHQLTRFGVAHDASDARFGISGIDEGRLAASQLLSATRDLTAIFATSDLVAAGAVHAAKDLGLSVPEHLTVCGVGDTELACRISADFSTVAIGSAEVAENAVKLALDLISGTQPMLGAARTVTPGPSPRLIVRASAHARPTAPSDGKTWR